MTETTADLMQHRIRHDVDQPLFGIHLLLDQIRTEQNESRVSAITQGVQFLGADLHRLLRYSLVREALVPKKVESLGDVCQRCVDFHQPIMDFARVELDVTLGAYSESPLPNAILVEYALGAILENAIEFSRDGRVGILAEPRGSGIAVMVCDSGAGITLADTEKMFDPFTTFNAGASIRPQRWGLGLATARLALAQCAASISVGPNDQEKTGGTVAAITLG